jgi:hypothetical protein
VAPDLRPGTAVGGASPRPAIRLAAPCSDPVGRPQRDPIGRPRHGDLGRQPSATCDPFGRPQRDPIGRPRRDPIGCLHPDPLARLVTR